MHSAWEMYNTIFHLLTPLVILSVEKTDAKYNIMHTAAQRKIAALRCAAGATKRQIFLPFSIISYQLILSFLSLLSNFFLTINEKTVFTFGKLSNFNSAYNFSDNLLHIANPNPEPLFVCCFAAFPL